MGLINLCLLVYSADNLCKQFGARSDPTERRVWSGTKLFDTWWYSWRIFFGKVDFEKKQTTKKHGNLPSKVNPFYVSWNIPIIFGNSFDWFYHSKHCRPCWGATLYLTVSLSKIYAYGKIQCPLPPPQTKKQQQKTKKNPPKNKQTNKQNNSNDNKTTHAHTHARTHARTHTHTHTHTKCKRWKNENSSGRHWMVGN